MRKTWVVFLRGNAAEANPLPHQHGNALGPHLRHDLHAIALNGALADSELERDRLTGEALYHQVQHLPLARCEPCKALAEIIKGQVPGKRVKGSRKASVDCRKKMSVVDRLLDEVFGTSLDCR